MVAVLSFDPDDSRYIAELAEYVAIPSVSRDSDPVTMRRAADWVAAQLAFAKARVVETAGNPIVVGEVKVSDSAPTILIYGHYDVQPTGSLDEWKSPPFELTVYGDRMRGRGATDDKGPVYVVLKVVQAFCAQEGMPPLNLKFIIEGEEEIGSPNFAQYVSANADQLAADLVVSADGAMWRPSEPSVSVASKGRTALDVVVTGADDDLHSGRYGGTVANPLHALAQILSSLHTSDGAVAVAGFYDGIPPLSDARRAEIAQVEFSEKKYTEELGLAESFGEPGYSTLERLWERPTLEVNGISGGGKYSVIPHVATANISCRLVPGQEPEHVLDVIEAHLNASRPRGVRVRVDRETHGVPAYTIAVSHPAVQAAAAALRHVYPGEGILFPTIGGTLPATTLFERSLGAKTLFFSFSTADEKLHAPNEFMRIRRLREGMRTWEQLLRLLAEGEHRLQPLQRTT
jgi:acetylornithine deacetylase/succinyl-diaminopimelate desuccinylase-like protein